MNSIEVFEHYRPILDKLFKFDMFNILFEEECLGEDLQEICDGVFICAGAHRCAVIDDNYDYIIKFCYNENCADCRREQEIYNNSGEFSSLFAECCFAGKYEKDVSYFYPDELEMGYKISYCTQTNHSLEGKLMDRHYSISIYAYPKANFEQCDEFSHRTLRKIRKKYATSPLAEYSVEIAAIFKSAVGAAKMKKFSLFLKTNRINDIHEGNVGYINGKPVIIDYAGF